jgi:GNAT superfamily N-acetyltransferase
MVSGRRTSEVDPGHRCCFAYTPAVVEPEGGLGERMTVRRARIEDVPAIVHLMADDMLGATRENPRLPLDPGYLAAFHAIDSDAGSFLAVAELDGEVVGTLLITMLHQLSVRGAPRAQLDEVRVAAGWRGRGLGHALVSWAIEESRLRGAATVQLTSDNRREDALRFYESMGFVATHRGLRLELDREPLH